MLDYIANGFLLFSDTILIIPLIIIGFIWLDRLTFYHAVCLLLLSILVNVALKISFQIPLSPSLGKKGYAFPSGHMQLVTVLYTWMALKIDNYRFRLLIVALLTGIGLSLIYFGYHNLYDVAAGIFFGLLLLFLYSTSSLKWPKNVPWFILVVSTLLLFYIELRTSQIADYVWMAYYTLWGLIIAEKTVNREIILELRSHKVVATFLCAFAMVGIHGFFYYLMTGQPIYIYQLQWLLFGFILPCINFCATRFIGRFNGSRE